MPFHGFISSSLIPLEPQCDIQFIPKYLNNIRNSELQILFQLIIGIQSNINSKYLHQSSNPIMLMKAAIKLGILVHTLGNL